MISRLADTAVARSGRELAEQLRSRPFRAALGISLLLHAVVLLGGWDVGGFGPRLSAMRVHILQPQIVPVDAASAEAAPAEVAVPQVSSSTPRPVAPVAEPGESAAPVVPAASAAAPAVAETTGELPVRADFPAHPLVTEGMPAPDAAVQTNPSTAQPEGVPHERTTSGIEPGLPVAAGEARPAIGAETAPGGLAAASPGMSAIREAGDGGDAGGAVRGDASARAGMGEGGAGPAVAAGPLAMAAPAVVFPAPGSQDLAAIRRRIDSRKRYPPMAVQNGWEGRVLVEMRLEDDGRLAAVRLLQGSGYAVLDEATMEAVRLASPFPPIARRVTVPVEYRLLP